MAKRNSWLLCFLLAVGYNTRADPVSELSAEPSPNEILLTWLNPSNGDYVGVLILRQVGTAVTATPANGVNYTQGQQLGADEVVYAGPGSDGSPDNPSAFVDVGLLPLTTYHYALFAQDDGMNYAAGVAVSATTAADNLPPSAVADLLAMGLTNAIALSWLNPSDADLSGITILSRVGSAPSGSLSNGLAYPVGTVVGDAEIVYAAPATPGTLSAWTNAGLGSGETHHYAVYAHDAPLNYAVPGTVLATTADQVPPNPVASLHADAGVRQLTLRWVNPTNTDYAGVLIVHGDDEVPTAVPIAGSDYLPGTVLGNGTVVYAGPASSVAAGAAAAWTHAGLEADSRHGYRVFAYDAPRNYATGPATLGRTAPLTPVVWLTFTNGAGSIATDDSGNGNHGTLGASVSWLPGNGPVLPDGRTLDAIAFAGSSDANNAVIILDSASLDFDKTQGTITFWIKPASHRERYCFVKTHPFDSSTGIEVAKSDLHGLFAWPYGWSDNCYGTLPLNLQVWQQVAYTWNVTNAPGSNMDLYVNGIRDPGLVYFRTGAVPGPTTTGNWILGQDFSGNNGEFHNRYYIGDMADVAVFDKALSPAQIFNLYSNGVAGIAGEMPPPPTPEALVIQVH